MTMCKRWFWEGFKVRWAFEFISNSKLIKKINALAAFKTKDYGESGPAKFGPNHNTSAAPARIKTNESNKHASSLRKEINKSDL